MSFAGLLVLLVGAAIAYANGSNDVSKGVATLVGSGVTDYRRAILWGTVWTAAGGFASAVLARAMVATFGSGLLASGTVPMLSAAIATLGGAALWVALSTRMGLPVSTTHAIVGALVGVAVVAYGLDGVRWSALSTKVLLPLLLSPVAALVLTRFGLHAVEKRWRSTRGHDCLCVQAQHEPVPLAVGDGVAALADLGVPRLRVTAGTSAECATMRPAATAVTLGKLHWLTSGTTSFARGVNDAPKMVALVLAAAAVAPGAAIPAPEAFVVVTLGMVAGSWVAGRRVTRLLAERVTPLDHGRGFAANLVTALLVTVGALFGLPMSTTHVSSGGIIGAAEDRGVDRRTVRDVLLAWVATLPGAALLGVGAYFTLRALSG